MSSLIPTSDPHSEGASLQRVWWLLLALGLMSILIGLLAISSGFIGLTTLTAVIVLGVLLLVAGATEVIHAVTVRNLKGFALHLLSAAIYLVAGLFMLEHPSKAATVLTLFIGASFLVGGLLRIIFSVVVRFHSWTWVVVQGIIDLILGGMILAEWPDSSQWVIGLFVGIDLLMNGWSWVVLALAVRTASTTRPAVG